jgi:hypothetical protein
MRTQAKLRQKGRTILLSAFLGLALAAGAVSPAFATGSSTSSKSMNKADTKRGNGHCAKGQCCSTGKGDLSHYGNGGGKGNGVNVGKRSAGCVVKAYKKNPPKQQRNGSAKTGQGDRNHGTSPKHRMSCDSAVKPPVVKPPAVKPSVVTPSVVTPSVVKPSVVVSPPGRTPVGGSPVVARTVVRSPVAGSPVVASAVRTPVVGSPPEAASNPLPLSSAAGRADTSGQLAAGGFAAFAALLALGAGFVLRRRRGDV